MKKKKIIIAINSIIIFIIFIAISQSFYTKKNDYIIQNNDNINFNLEYLNYDAKSNYYYVFTVVNNLTGTLKHANYVKKFSYKIEDEKGRVLLEKDIDIKKEWIINDIGFALGLNKLIVEVEYYDSNTSKKEIEFLNMNEKNSDHLDIDLEDSDKDGIYNYYEAYFGTDKDNYDTDGDGISDYHEIFRIATDPLAKDDIKYINDRINKFKSRDITSSEIYIEEVLSEDNDAIPSVKCKENTSVNLLQSRVEVGKNGIIGKIVNVQLDDKNSIELSFNVYKSLEKGNNINNFIVCKVKNNTYIPLETDRYGGKISVNVNESGDYFVLDVDTFLSKLEVNLNKDNNVLLKNFKVVSLKGKLDKDNNIDSDGDGVSDYKELRIATKKDLGIFINQLIDNKDSDIYNYSGIREIEIYDNVSDPSLKDSDGDGFNDNVDPTPLEATAFKSFEKYKSYIYGDLDTLTIINRQPYLGSRKIININNLNAGHSEIRVDSSNNKVNIYGFYPDEDYSLYDVVYLKSSRGRLITNDGYYLTDNNKSDYIEYDKNILENKLWNIGKTFIINKNDANKIDEYTKNFKCKYDMVISNCTSFVIDILDEIGIETRFVPHYWNYMSYIKGCISGKFYGYTPADLGQDISENYSTYITYENIVLTNGTITKAVVINN